MQWERLQSERKWLIVYLILSGIYMIWRICFTLPFGYGFVPMLLGLILLVAECLGIFDFLVHFIGVTRLIVPVKPTLDEDVTYPEVDVFIATYNEPWEIIYKTVIGCQNMKYPRMESVHIYVLDDGHRDELKRKCQKLGVGYITRDSNEHAKAGNINNALQQTHSPYIVTFDADMIPRHNFLLETIPFFIDNALQRKQQQKDGVKEKDLIKKIGFIQAPQVFYNPDIFQYQLFSEDVIPNEQDYFHREVQLAKNASNSVIYSGSNTVIAREALEAVEGFVTGIITEDIATGIRIQAKGYQTIALNKVLATGLAPYDLEAIVKQRNRWARGCIQTFRRVNPMFIKGLTFSQRLNYFDSMLYWYSSFKRFIFIVSPLLFTVFGMTVVRASLLQVIFLWLPMYVFNTIMYKKFSGNGRTMKWTNIYETILMPTLMPAVFLESLGLKMKKFEVTSKKRNVEQATKYRLKLIIPHAILFFFTVLGIVHCVIEMFWLSNGGNYIINLFWLLVNGYGIMMALFFILERPVYRGSERFKIKTPLSFVLNGETHQATTVDISETGVSFVTDYPFYFKVNESYSLTIQRDAYKTHLSTQFLRVDSLDETIFKYAFKYTDIKQSDYEQLVLILFDRIPDFPTKILSQSIFRDMTRNTKNRWDKGRLYSRYYPRITVEQLVKVSTRLGEQSAYLKEFNYEYIVMDKNNEVNQLNLLLGMASIEYEFVRPLENGNGFLYHVTHELQADQLKEIEKAVNVWCTHKRELS